MKEGFTLAEVLITLTIIGVVATLVVPNAISSYKQNQYRTAAKKAHYTLLQANMVVAELDKISYEEPELYIKKLIEYMNPTTVIKGSLEINNLPSHIKVKEGSSNFFLGIIDNYLVGLQTADNMIYYILDSAADGSFMSVVVDVNGEEGPSNSSTNLEEYYKYREPTIDTLRSYCLDNPTAHLGFNADCAFDNKNVKLFDLFIDMGIIIPLVGG